MGFDFAKPETFAPALAGHDLLFLIGPLLVPDLDTVMRPFTDFLIAAGPRRVVYLSANGMDALPELPSMPSKKNSSAQPRTPRSPCCAPGSSRKNSPTKVGPTSRSIASLFTA